MVFLALSSILPFNKKSGDTSRDLAILLSTSADGIASSRSYLPIFVKCTFTNLAILHNIGSAISDFVGNLAKNWKNSKFTAQIGGKIDIGAQLKFNAANVVKVKADFVSFELLKGNLDFTKMFDSNVYSDEDDSATGTYIGENGVNVEQGLEAEVNLQAIGFKDVGLGGAFKHTFNTNNTSNGNVDYDILVGVPVLKKTSSKMVEKIVSTTTQKAMNPFDPISALKSKGGKKQNLYGLDLGFGAALILGVDVNIKLGFEY